MLTFLIYALIILGLITRSSELIILALPFILYLGLGFAYKPQDIQLQIKRHISDRRVSPHQPVSVTLTIRNLGHTLEQVTLTDTLPQGLMVAEGHVSARAILPPEQEVALSYTVTGPRGHYRFNRVDVEVSDHLNLFHRQATFQIGGQLFILPEVLRLRRADIRPRRTRIYAGQIPARQGGPGVEFFDLREYQQGDPLRWVNPRASARHPQQRIFVNQFEQERAADIGLILDVRQQSNISIGEETLFEYGVSATAALADILLTQGNRVGLLLYGDVLDWTYPGYGKVQRERILQALSKAQPSDRLIFEDLKRIPARLFPVRSQIILISPLTPDDQEAIIQLRARDYPLTLISPDPIAFELNFLRADPQRETKNHQARDLTDQSLDLAERLARLERGGMLRGLRRSGVRVIEWQVETPFQQIARAALERIQIR